MTAPTLLEQDIAGACYEAIRAVRAVAGDTNLFSWKSVPEWTFTRYCQAVAQRRKDPQAAVSVLEMSLDDRRSRPHGTASNIHAGEIFASTCRALLPLLNPVPADDEPQPTRLPFPAFPPAER